ncbi:MAG TPA: hypothetical protein VK826_08070 [Bacteroidia bacterium]|nr:hypothetical protein [Bacteroidia bacterium]
MKKYFTGIYLLFIAVQASAGSFQDQLESMNANWTSFRSMQFAGNAKYFPDDRTFVQAHFAAVEIVLRNADVSALSQEQRAARNKNIQVLHAYATRGIFPANHCSYSTPVFIDEFNTHCAVGHLMEQSGFEVLAVRISSRNNLVHAADIDDPEIYAWQEASGFSMEELALIQPAYAAPPEAIEQPYACTTVYFGNYTWNYIKGVGNQPQPEQPKQVWYSGECQNNVLHGKWEQYHSPDQIWIRGNFKQGKKDGQWKYFGGGYYAEGKMQEGRLQKLETWVNGKLHGPFVAYDYAGKKSSEGVYVNGMKDGLWKYWSNAALNMEENYAEGKLHGEKTQYWGNADSTKKSIVQHNVYTHGVLQTRENYSQGDVLSTQMKHIIGNRYQFVQYSTVGKISMIGESELSVRLDSFENMMYPNLPKTYHEYEVLTKVGRWTHFPNYSHRLLAMYATQQATANDSAHIYYSGSTDSVCMMVRFWSAKTPSDKNGTKLCYDSTEYRNLQPDRLDYYQQYNLFGAERWTFEDGQMTIHSAMASNGIEYLHFEYKNGQVVSGATKYPNGEYREIWSISTFTGQPVLHYQQRDTNGRVLMKGPIIHTTTRYGEWEFYDSTGAVTAKGEYKNGLKEGTWTETYANGTVWTGEYKNGKKKGTWTNTSPPKEGVIRKEKF